jgi:hypothetical protein
VSRGLSDRDQALPAEFRFSRASSWTFFIKVCSVLQQISHKASVVVRQEMLVTAGAIDMDARPSQIVVRFAEAAIANECTFVPIGVSSFPV